jgi:hypothetical protein
MAAATAVPTTGSLRRDIGRTMTMENMMRKAIVAAATYLIMGPLAAVAQNGQGQPNPFQGGSTSAPSSQAPAQTTRAPARTAASAATGANQYQSEGQAKQACGTDTVVWVNTSGSKAWHVSGDKYYGHTKRGTYMCQQAAGQAGYHASGSPARKAIAQTH